MASETIPLAVGDFILSVADLMGNFVLLHRCWVVWERNYFILLFPALSALGGFGEYGTSLHPTACPDKYHFPLQCAEQSLFT